MCAETKVSGNNKFWGRGEFSETVYNYITISICLVLDQSNDFKIVSNVFILVVYSTLQFNLTANLL